MSTFLFKGNLQYPQHRGDVGHDLIAASPPNIVGGKLNLVGMDDCWSYIDYIEYDTKVGIEPVNHSMKNLFSLVFPRSSISKTNLVLANSIGLIDEDYRGNIKLRFKYIIQPHDLEIIGGSIVVKVDPNKIYRMGDRIAQVVFMEQEKHKIYETHELSETRRGSGGFGSTGK